VLVCQTWAVCGFRVVVVEDYNSTTSALFLYSFFGYSIVKLKVISNHFR
jgi:hypothetical protein